MSSPYSLAYARTSRNSVIGKTLLSSISIPARTANISFLVSIYELILLIFIDKVRNFLPNKQGFSVPKQKIILCNMHIGLEIKKLAREENITLAELGKRIGRNKQSVYEMVEKEDINTGLLRKVALALNVPISHFFCDECGSDVKTVVGSIVTGDNINSSINNFDAATQEVALLKEKINSLEKLLEEKERLIKVLLAQK